MSNQSTAELSERLRQLELVAQVGRRVASTLDLDEVLRATAQEARRALDCYATGIALIEGDSLVFHASDTIYGFWDKAHLAHRRHRLDGDGIFAWVAQNRQTLYVPDTAVDARFAPSPVLPLIGAEVVTPLIVEQRLVGVMNALADHSHAFCHSDIELLETIAAHVAAAVRNAQLHAETRGAVERLEALQHIGAEMTSQLDLPALLHTILERAFTLLGGDDGGVYLYDPVEDDLRLEATAVPERVGRRLRLGEGASGLVFATGEPLIVPDYRQWSQSAQVFADAMIRSVVAVPMVYRDERIGVMTVAHTQEAGRFGMEDMRLLSLLAQAAAIAIVNARLMAKTRSATVEARQQRQKAIRHLEQLRFFHEAGHRLRAEGLLADLLQSVAEQIQTAFGYPHVDIALLDGDALAFLAASSDIPDYVSRTRGYRRALSIPGVVTHVAKTAQTYQVTDSAHDPYYAPSRDEYYTASELCVPLMSGGRAIGVLNLESRERNAFDESDVALAEGLAAQIAATIQNAQLLEQVRREQARLAQALDHVAGGVATLDPAGRVLSLNPNAAALLGVDAAPARGMAADELLSAHGDGATSLSQLIERTVAQHQSFAPGETLFAPNAGTRADRLLAVSLAPMADSPSGTVNSLVLGLWDVTERAQLERLRSELDTVVAHELRSPLTRMLLSAERAPYEQMDAAGQESFLKIMAEIRLLIRIVDNILQASHIEAGRLVLELMPVAVTPLVRQVLRPFQPAERFRMEIAPDVPLANADQTRLHLALANLVSNAAAYSPPAEPVCVRVAREGAEAIRFSVADRGDGIAPEEQERIFQRFTRLPDGRARRASGSGLGLYIARGLVEAHGGRLWVESTPGAGATFHFTVPAYNEGPHGQDLDR